MSERSELERAQAEMIAVLDGKIGTMPEWRAFRAIARALAAIGREAPPPAKAPADAATARMRAPRPDSYAELGLKAMEESGLPLSTEQMLEYIGKHRDLSGDIKKIRVNVQSAFSKDSRFKNLAWKDGRAWWFSERPVPPNPAAAGSLLEVPAATH